MAGHRGMKEWLVTLGLLAGAAQACANHQGNCERNGSCVAGTELVFTAPDAGLPAAYAVAGKVTKGDDVVELLANIPNDPADNRPTEPVIIENAEVVSR